ncbi:MAG TPA: 5'-nucleotidase, lipoprotein e(P4) family [Thermoanaerobaculia bacterium]|nr:5'-nucleotidase, lipoprotein e(P4) family [Thermoanaerobaculia bacterium]
MNRTLLLLPLLTLTLLSCATTPPATAPLPPAPCHPGHSILNATLWVQHAAEYRAAATQTYANARRALDLALADRDWVGASEETANDPSQPPAVVLDLDETALDNTPFEARVIRAGKTYDPATWKEWTAEGAAPAIPGAAEFLAYAKSRGVTPFYVTNRDEDERTGTYANLQRLGFPVTPETLLLRQNNVSDKSPRRAQVAGTHRLLLLIGDDLNDFVNAREKSQAERAQLIAGTASWWGTRWFILPNPMYGSWERALIGSGGTPCEQLQRKVDALRDK